MTTIAGANLPDELMLEILSRLPPKSLGRFKCVSKPWRTLISDPKFIKHQLIQTNRRRESVIFSRFFQPLLVVDFEGDPFNNGRISSVLKLDEPNGWLSVCGSCHGLVVALSARYELYLLNPTFREFKKLSFPCSSGVGRRVFGFGYDSLADDYKVVIFRDDDVWVYTLKHNCWKKVQNPHFSWLGTEITGSEFGDSGFLVNGCIHLLGKRYVESSVLIVAFDLADEKFLEVPLPCDLTGESQLQLGVLGGFLCLTNSTTDVWLMREYGVKESWSRLRVYQPRGYHIRPLLLTGDADFLLIMNVGKLVVYNVKEKTSRDIECHGLSVERNFQVRTFAASLVSPKQWD